MATDRWNAEVPGPRPDFGALLLSVLEQTTLRLNLRDDEGRFMAFNERPDILPVARTAAVGRPSWDRAQYLRADGRERSTLDHPAQEARRTGIAQVAKRLGVRFANGEEHWVLGDFVPVARGPSGYEVLSVLQDTTEIETERREAVRLADELRRAMAVATAIAVAAPRTCAALVEAVRAPLTELLPNCQAGIGWRVDGEQVSRMMVLSELPGMARFDPTPKKTPDVGQVIARHATYLNNNLGPADIVGPRAIGTDPVPARSALLLPLNGARECGVLVAYSQQPDSFTPARVTALEALAPALAASLDRLERSSEAAA